MVVGVWCCGATIPGTSVLVFHSGKDIMLRMNVYGDPLTNLSSEYNIILFIII